ncbi:MAG: hypothetical protein Q4C83_01435 [Candidatus Saccharibacteria bacterium]|nr:hypothetical protein [Candidatus Saccharibacteria bacterium]
MTNANHNGDRRGRQNDSGHEQGSNLNIPVEQMQEMLETMRAMREEIRQLREENVELRERLDRIENSDVQGRHARNNRNRRNDDNNEDDNEDDAAETERTNRRQTVRRGVGFCAIGAMMRRFFGGRNRVETNEADDVDTSEDDNAAEDDDTTRTTRSSRTRQNNRRERRHSSDESDNEDEDTEDNHNRGRRGRKFLIGAAASLAIVAAAAGIGGSMKGRLNNEHVQEITSSIANQTDNSQEVTYEQAGSLLADLNQDVADMNGYIANPDGSILPFDSISSENQDALKEAAERAKALQTIYQQKAEIFQKAEAAGVNADTFNKYQADLRQINEDLGTTINMDTYLDLQAQATENFNGEVSVSDYVYYKNAADNMNMDVKTVKKLADKFGVDPENIGTEKAMEQLRDNLEGERNVNEKFDTDDPTEWRDAMKFVAYNNPAALSMYMGAIYEDNGEVDEGIDGLEDPASIQELYAKYIGDKSATTSDFNKLRDMLDKATITSRAATDRTMFSYFISDQNKMVVSSGPENTYGQTDTIWQVEFENGTVILVKNGCFQTEAGRPVAPVVVKENTPSTPSTPNQRGDTPSTPTPNKPTPNTPTQKLEPKDEHANDAQEKDANGFKDKAPATNNNQTYNGKEDSNAQVNSGNTDGNASNGSEVVPDSTNQNGDVPGKQEERPTEQDW